MRRVRYNKGGGEKARQERRDKERERREASKPANARVFRDMIYWGEQEEDPFARTSKAEGTLHEFHHLHLIRNNLPY